jgi:type II secretory ATPase GspE/PulE/Tfp pilus assembly ATPase PilB-like protein
VTPYLVSQALAGVVFQQLVRRVCPACRQEYEAPALLKRKLGVDPNHSLRLSRGAGCRECLNTGYRGRVGVFEILAVDDDFRHLVVGQPTSRQLQEAAVAAGMVPLGENVRRLVLDGVTTFEESQRVVAY